MRWLRRVTTQSLHVLQIGANVILQSYPSIPGYTLLYNTLRLLYRKLWRVTMDNRV